MECSEKLKQMDVKLDSMRSEKLGIGGGRGTENSVTP